MKTSELTGAALDWAVTKCELPKNWNDTEIILGYDTNYSTDWALAGEIIEREGISLYLYSDSEWNAHLGNKEYCATTPLIAAMRCYVASKLGDEVEVPEELLDYAHE